MLRTLSRGPAAYRLRSQSKERWRQGTTPDDPISFNRFTVLSQATTGLEIAHSSSTNQKNDFAAFSMQWVHMAIVGLLGYILLWEREIVKGGLQVGAMREEAGDYDTRPF